MGELVRVSDLTVAFHTQQGILRAVDQVSLTIAEGEVFAVVGESGCGKSTLAFGLLNMIPEPGYIESGSIVYSGRDIVKYSEKEMRNIRGREIAMVFQASMNSFNPVLRFRNQVNHIFEAHPGVWPNVSEGMDYFRHLLELVRLRPDSVLTAYPHELSGGMKQRMAIATSLLMKPKLLLLDEPTTALDVLNQRLVLEILRNLHDELNLTIVFVTHDLGVVADIADRVCVMYGGKVAEIGSLEQVFYNRVRHPYVTALLEAAPSPFDRDMRAKAIPGSVPNLVDLLPGCRFASRCPLVEPKCRSEEPVLRRYTDNHEISCHVMDRELSVFVSGGNEWE